MRLSKEEKETIRKTLGDDYIIIDKVAGKCYALSLYGKYSYNDCFMKTTNEHFLTQKYELLTPNKMIRFNNWYLLEPKEEPGVWYRGFLTQNENYEFDCCADSLEEIIWSLQQQAFKNKRRGHHEIGAAFHNNRNILYYTKYEYCVASP